MLLLKEPNPCRHPLVSLPQSQWIWMMSEEIYRRIRQQAGLSQSGSVGDVTLQPEPIGVMTQGRLVLHKRTPEQSQMTQFGIRDQPVSNTEATMGAVGGYTIEHTSMLHG